MIVNQNLLNMKKHAKLALICFSMCSLFAFSGFLTLAGIMLSDLLYVAADPRIKLT